MNPVSLNTGFYASAYPGMRPEFPVRKAHGADPIAEPAAAPLGGGNSVQPGQGFDNVLGNLVNEVNAKQVAAGDKVTGLLSGQNVPLHQAMIAMEEASVSFQLMLEVRNKLLEGYQELMRMHV